MEVAEKRCGFSGSVSSPVAIDDQPSGSLTETMAGLSRLPSSYRND